ncbi:MAG: HTH domain-containing protein [Promethearchaeia archaeon]
MISAGNSKITFRDLPENIRKLLARLEHDKIIILNSDYINLNSKIIEQKELYSQAINLIKNHFKGIEQEIALFIIDYIYNKKQDYITYSLIDYDYKYRSYRSTIISSGKKDHPDKDNTSGSSGGSPSPSSDFGDRAPEIQDYKNISDLPTYLIPELISKRKDDFGIWISKEALRHFESMKCTLDPDGELFRKIETYFNPVYGLNLWATPINNKKRDDKGLSFSLQIHQNGHIRIHLSNKNDNDVEKFIADFFEIFNFLTDVEKIQLLESLLLERFDKPCFYVHDAREIGPKKIIDEEFKGAHIRVNQVNWFGKTKYDVRIDYSIKQKPHIEAEGPIQQVGNLMRLLDGTPEFISNLSEVRELCYRTRDKVHDTYIGIGKISESLNNTGEILQIIDTKLDGIAINQISNQQLIDILERQIFPKIKETIIQARDQSSLERAQIRNSLIELITQLLNLDSNINNTIQNCKNELEDTIIVNAQDLHLNIDNTREIIAKKIDDLDKNISDRFDDLRQLLDREFSNVKARVKYNLFWIMQKLDQIPSLTAREIADQLNVSRKTVYQYLRKLQEKGLIIGENERKGKRGRPPKRYFLNIKRLLNLRRGVKD